MLPKMQVVKVRLLVADNLLRRNPYTVFGILSFETSFDLLILEV